MVVVASVVLGSLWEVTGARLGGARAGSRMVWVGVALALSSVWPVAVRSRAPAVVVAAPTVVSTAASSSLPVVAFVSAGMGMEVVWVGWASLGVGRAVAGLWKGVVVVGVVRAVACVGGAVAVASALVVVAASASENEWGG